MHSFWTQTFFPPPPRHAVTIQFSGSSILDSATVGTAVGTATISGGHSGSPTWSLSNSAGGKYAIDSVTGIVTVASALVDGVDTIGISVSGVVPSPTPNPRSFNITVSPGASPSLDFSDPNNSQYIGPII